MFEDGQRRRNQEVVAQVPRGTSCNAQAVGAAVSGTWYPRSGGRLLPETCAYHRAQESRPEQMALRISRTGTSVRVKCMQAQEPGGQEARFLLQKPLTLNPEMASPVQI